MFIVRIILAVIFLLSSYLPARALDASPFNTQSAEISHGGWWTLFYDSAYDRNSSYIAAPFAELRYTFNDKLRLGLLTSLTYAEAEGASAFGLSNLIVTTEYEVYDFEKHDFLRIAGHEIIDHAAVFFNQSIPTSHNSLLGNSDYSFNTGLEWQRTVTKHAGLYSEWGYSYDGDGSHSLLYNNSIALEIHHWIQPYCELLGRTNFSSGDTSLILAPGISFLHGNGYHSYFSPLVGLTNDDFDWGFQVAFLGKI